MTKDEVLAVVEDQAQCHSITETTPVGDLELDSLEFMNLLVELGIPDAEIEGIHTVADLIAKAA